MTGFSPDFVNVCAIPGAGYPVQVYTPDPMPDQLHLQLSNGLIKSNSLIISKSGREELILCGHPVMIRPLEICGVEDMRVVRIFTGSDGESHFEDVDIDLTDAGPGGRLSAPVATRSVIFRETPTSYDLDFHPAPRRQYVVNLRGGVEIEVGSGERRILEAGDILLAEDTSGRGHKSRAVNGEARECLFITLE